VHKPRQRLLTSLGFRCIYPLLASCVGAAGLSGCVAVGYSSGRGWFVWPGGLGLSDYCPDHRLHFEAPLIGRYPESATA